MVVSWVDCGYVCKHIDVQLTVTHRIDELVPSTTLCELDEHAPTFVKMDIEGGEVAIMTCDELNWRITAEESNVEAFSLHPSTDPGARAGNQSVTADAPWVDQYIDCTVLQYSTCHSEFVSYKSSRILYSTTSLRYYYFDYRTQDCHSELVLYKSSRILYSSIRKIPPLAGHGGMAE